MTAPMVDYKIHWLKMMSVPESRAVVGRHDGINEGTTDLYQLLPQRGQRPVLDLLRQSQRPHEVGEIVGQGVKLQPDGVIAEPATRQPRPFDRVLAFP